jgi:hypothetical protein
MVCMAPSKPRRRNHRPRAADARDDHHSNYFRLYEKLAGMTGTAETEANEFHDVYKLGVAVIPSNEPASAGERFHLQDAAREFNGGAGDRRHTPECNRCSSVR